MERWPLQCGQGHPVGRPPKNPLRRDHSLPEFPRRAIAAIQWAIGLGRDHPTILPRRSMA